MRTFFITHIILPDWIQIPEKSSTIDHAFNYEHSHVTSIEKLFGATSGHGGSLWTSPLRMRPSRHQLAAEGTISGFMPES